MLVINGNARATGTMNKFYGVLFITGDFRSVGNPEFYGSSIIQGEIEKAAGTPYFIYDPVSASNAGSLGRRSPVSGTWRDWL
ncbi:hypothetical protein [Thiorhodospira sibirica]|uniref:hypothetical protein n=1 Tax=Thiorhodospira sibirica TaxID=154347 RepID=UPI0011124F67|nr:hypothetical protein [Thiorhodospira sibirica]